MRRLVSSMIKSTQTELLGSHGRGGPHLPLSCDDRSLAVVMDVTSTGANSSEENAMNVNRLSVRTALVLSAFALSAPLSLNDGHVAQAQQITSPEQFFGFQMGADRKMARWDRMVEYYKLLEQSSDRIDVVEMGPSTLGNTFLALFISAPGNLARLEELRQINAKLSDPRGMNEPEIETLIAAGKVVINQSMSLHATEIGGSLMAVELAYDLVSRDDSEAQRILDNVIFVMIPSLNPDGQIMVTDWYRETVGTEFEGAGYPSLYHHYTGHDNNRDAFMANTVESQYQAKLMFRDWIPQAYIDHHHMGSYSARFYVPPYAEPIRPFSDPLVWREMSWYGAHIAYKEEEAGLSGIVNSAIYGGWGHFGFHWITPFHNIAGMLTEAANTRLATPIYIHPDQLQGGRRQLPDHEPQTTFPNDRGVVAAARHRGAAEDLCLGHTRHRGTQQGDRVTQRLPQGQAPDGARCGWQAGCLCDSGRATRSAHFAHDDQQAAGSGHRGSSRCRRIHA